MTTFKGLVLRRNGAVTPGIESLTPAELKTDGDVLIRVDWSGINYKDALAVLDRGKIVRGDYPFVPGIDLAGEVVESHASRYRPGDRVLATGWGIGEKTWGGLAQLARLKSEWLVPLPRSLSARDAMIVGTAGFTAMLSVKELESQGVTPGQGEVVVTGASGGVGSFSVLALSRAGFNVVASTGKKDEAAEHLHTLGAGRIIDRSDLSAGAERPMVSARWTGCIDSVGSTTLEAVISQMDTHGVIAACGLAGGHELHTTVYPFILRGVKLIGIDSNTCPFPRRRRAWERLADLAREFDFSSIATEIELEDVPDACREVLAGRVTGRIIVRMQNAS